MPRSRVLSFMSQWGSPSPSNEAGPTAPPATSRPFDPHTPLKKPPPIDTATPQSLAQRLDQSAKASPGSPNTPSQASRARGDSRATTRPNSMIQTYQPPQVEVAQDTPPELQPIFSYLNSHSNKLYQEGYFLKLHDLDSRGRPSGDRVWVECFAQLVGTVLSLWDAAALDAAGEDGEVMPTFINLSDASIKMIESLPMSGVQGGSLQNVLSISTAANNRYLLHFNSLNSLTQWTAGIRLAMFEHATLQEAYTGSLVAGKGKYLNNIKIIMERSKFAHEDWARVRFGAGTPWKRCWCVVSPPDEKEYAKAQKALKKSGAYDRAVMPRGDIKFYDTRKVTKKTQPIATVTDAYAAYAIYPQSKPLIEQSTLVKLEGLVTIHTSPATTTEGFVFVMPEVHPAVTGFEMMLRWLFPVYDTFALYGRPQRLIADTLDQRGLMFAMPTDRRYGYLDILDVSGLIHTGGSQAWSERQWRQEMKKLTSQRMLTQADDTAPRQMSQRRNTTSSRTSLPLGRAGVRFDDDGSQSFPPSRTGSPIQIGGQEARFNAPRRTDSAPPGQQMAPHKRSVSDAQGYKKYMTENPSRLSYEQSRPNNGEMPPAPPRHGGALGASLGRGQLQRIQSEAEVPTISTTYDDVHNPTNSPMPAPVPVASPPAFTHNPSSHPANRPLAPPELRRAHSNVDAATLYQMQDVSRRDRTPEEDEDRGEEPSNNRVSTTNPSFANRNLGTPADRMQGMVSSANSRQNPVAKHKLSPIPGSPYVGGDGFQPMDQRGVSQVDGVVDGLAGLNMLQQEPAAGPPPPPIHGGNSILRKPVSRKPVALPSDPMPASYEDTRHVADDARSETSDDYAGLRGALIDTEVLEQILQSENNRSPSMSSHASSVSPDYASTAPSIKSERKSVERPRAGRMKTVGDPDLLKNDPVAAGPDVSNKLRNMPTVDFGPTYAYKPHTNSRPGTSGTITPGMMLEDRSESRSGDRLRDRSRDRLSTVLGPNSPAENNRNSYFGGRATPSPGGMTPTDGDLLQPGNRHSIAWTPSGGSPGDISSRQGLTAEQWVQYRAAIASQPQQAPPRAVPNFAHQRTASAGSMSKLRMTSSKTPPPFGRTASGDWSQQERATPPSRPHSRGASVHLNQLNPSGLVQSAQSANLSAREQMHVARMTGTPLISMNNDNSKKQQADQAPGLVGALAAREREKAAMKEGIRGGMVDHAIRARQQQQAQAEAEAQMQAQLQAQHQAQHAMQAQQIQQQVQGQMYAKTMLAQNQAPIMYPGGQQRQAYAQMSNQRQSQYYNQQPMSGYGTPGPGTAYGPAPGAYEQQQMQLQQQQQQMMMMQQQQQAAQSPRASVYGGSYFGGLHQPQQQMPPGGQQWQGQGRR